MCQIIRNLLLKEKIRSHWEEILSYKISSHFEKGRNQRALLHDQVF